MSAHRRKSSLPNLTVTESVEKSPSYSYSVPQLQANGKIILDHPCTCKSSPREICNACVLCDTHIELSGSYENHCHSDTELLNPKLQEYLQDSSDSSEVAEPGTDSKINSFSSSSEEISKRLLCLSDKTMDCATTSFQSFPAPGRTFNNRGRCRFCFRDSCYGCRYFIGYSKVSFLGRHSTCSMTNVARIPRTPQIEEEGTGTERTKYTRKQKLSLLCLGFVNLTAFLSMSIIAPFFPYEASLKNMRETVSGMVFSVYALVTMLACPVFGKLAPHVGVKFIYLSGIFVCGVSNILFGVLAYIQDETLFAVFCFVVRSFEALGAAAFTTAANIMVLNTFPDDIGTVFGLMETSVGIGMSLGPAIGGGLYSLGGYGLPFYILGSVVLINLPMSWWLLDVKEGKFEQNGNSSYKKLLSIPMVIVISVVVVVASQAQGFIDPTLEPHLRQYGLNPGIVGILFLLMSAAYAIFSPVVGYLTGKYEIQFPTMLGGLLIMTVAMLLLGPSPFLPFDGSNLGINIVAIVLLGASLAIAFIPTFEAIFDAGIEGGLSDDLGTYSIVSGLWTSMYSLGEVTGPTLGGVLSDFLDFPEASTTMAICCFLTALLICGVWLWSCKKDHKKKMKDILGNGTVAKDSSETDHLIRSSKLDYGSTNAKA